VSVVQVSGAVLTAPTLVHPPHPLGRALPRQIDSSITLIRTRWHPTSPSTRERRSSSRR